MKLKKFLTALVRNATPGDCENDFYRTCSQETLYNGKMNAILAGTDDRVHYYNRTTFRESRMAAVIAFSSGFPKNTMNPFLQGEVAIITNGFWQLITTPHYTAPLDFLVVPEPVPAERLLPDKETSKPERFLISADPVARLLMTLQPWKFASHWTHYEADK